VERQQRAARRVWRVWRETAKGEGVWMEAAEKRRGREGQDEAGHTWKRRRKALGTEWKLANSLSDSPGLTKQKRLMPKMA
jgi:hypothetical protein